MIPVEQTELLPPKGNCFAACVASILELPLEQVPDFDGPGWYQQWNEWLAARGLMLISFTIPTVENEGYTDQWKPSGYTILGAKSPRGDWTHAVVAKDGVIVWDPHPKREMGVGQWLDWTIFQSLDPS